MKRIDRMEQVDNKSNVTKRRMSWVWLGLALLYDLSPIDLIPDIPVIGWIDDFFLTSAALFNVMQLNFPAGADWFIKFLAIAKWIALGIGIIVILLVLLLGTMLYSIFAN